MKHPRMTVKVRRGLSTLVGLAESYLEGDMEHDDESGEGYYPTLGDFGTKEHNEQAAEIEAAQAWIKAGGLATREAKP